MDQSEEGDYDAEDAPEQKLEIQEDKQGEYGPEVNVGDHDDEQKGDDDMMIDLNELDPNEKQMLLQYLQEEYDKHPEQFPFPKEQLAQIIEQENFDLLRDQIRILQQ